MLFGIRRIQTMHIIGYRLPLLQVLLLHLKMFQVLASWYCTKRKKENVDIKCLLRYTMKIVLIFFTIFFRNRNILSSNWRYFSFSMILLKIRTKHLSTKLYFIFLKNIFLMIRKIDIQKLIIIDTIFTMSCWIITKNRISFQSIKPKKFNLFSIYTRLLLLLV